MSWKYFSIPFLFSVILISSPSWGGPGAPGVAYVPQSPYFQSITQFGLDMARRSNVKITEPNVATSGLSGSQAFSLLLKGARSDSKAIQELRRGLFFPRSLSEQALVEGLVGCRDLLVQGAEQLEDEKFDIEKADNPIVAIFNGVYPSLFRNLKRDYRSFVESAGAIINPLNFNNSNEAARIINGDVRKTTYGYIPELVTPNAVKGSDLVIANALFYASKWTYQFHSRGFESQFHVGGNKKAVERPFVNGVVFARVYDNRKFKFKALELPLGQNQGGSFFIFMPDNLNGLNSFYDQLTIQNWIQWMQGFEGTPSERTQVQFPKFGFEIGFELWPLFESNPPVGLAYLMSPQAHLDQIVDGSLSITRGIQKIFIRAYEVGLIAAGATTLISREALMNPAKQSFTVDRPFFFGIADMRTGMLLFSGHVSDPKWDSGWDQ